MFAELGYDRTTIRAVARAAGVDGGLVMHYFGGLSHQEIATKLNRPLGTIKTRVRLGLHKLGGLLIARGLHASDAW